ncbi:MAG: hypothetical protein N4A46_12490 [Schleiferiaceae bacterium]|jgi:hypothetical protein|nr:hypothetical protein [Schleiferiaceae bacterium]
MQKLLSILCVALCFAACDKGQLKPNLAPDTHIALESINLQGQFRLNSVVRLTWYGTDSDGYVPGFELSIDGVNWVYTTTQDSTFKFELPPGEDTVDVDFYVRSIDDKNATDPTPAHLVIPLKNTPPEVDIDVTSEPNDTVLGVATWRWFARDNDGDQTIVSAEIKFNNGSWYAIDPQQNLLSFEIDPNAVGTATAKVYYGNTLFAQPNTIDGLVPEGDNEMYIRVSDIAGAFSEVDTSKMVFFKKPQHDFLVISGQPQSVTNTYLPILDNLNLDYDFIDFGINGGENQPAFWNPTFRLTLRQYKTLFVYSDPSVYNNPTTGETKSILANMGQGIQEFTNDGNKVLITTSFSKTSDLSEIQGTYPIDGLETSNGQARLTNDSSLYPVVVGNYPMVQPTNIIIGVVPMIATADAEIFYRAGITKLSGWTGDNVVASRRRFSGNINHVFFAMELHLMNKDLQKLEDLFEEILINDFNW